MDIDINAVTKRISETTGMNSQMYLEGKEAGATWAADVADADDMERFLDHVDRDKIAEAEGSKDARELLAGMLCLDNLDDFSGEDAYPQSKQFVLGIVDGASEIFAAVARKL